MKKKLFSILLVAAIAASFAGCDNKKKKKDDSSGVQIEVTAQQYAASIKHNAEIYKQYVTIPEYMGVQIKSELETYIPSESEVEEFIDGFMKEYSTYGEAKTEGVTQKGDEIVLDYQGKLNGVAFSGGTATDASYTVGSGMFISDLDEGLEGLTLGEEYDIPCTFPENYSSADLAGKQVIFTVKVTKIKVKIAPELTDEWVAANAADLGVNAKNVEEFKQAVRDYLQEQNISKIFNLIYSELEDKIEVSGYPSDELDSIIKVYNDNVESEFKSNGSTYGCSSVEDYVKKVYQFESLDAFNEYSNNYAKDYLRQKMVMFIIAADNNIDVLEDEIVKEGELIASLSPYYENYDDILEQWGNQINSDIGNELLYKKVEKLLTDNAIITK